MPKQVESSKDPFFKQNTSKGQENKNWPVKTNKPESREKGGKDGHKQRDPGSADVKHKFKFVKGAFGKSRSASFNANNETPHNGNTRNEAADHDSKKPFDKKLYRMKKYSNKYKLDQWENKRRKEVIKKYYKDIKSDPMAGKYRPIRFDEEPQGFDETDKIHYVLHPDRLEEMKQKFGKGGKHDKANRNPHLKAKDEMQRLKQEKAAAKEAKLKAAKEREEAIAKYKVKKAERFKKLSKKTKSGQPVMRDRMQMLLESIQNSI